MSKPILTNAQIDESGTFLTVDIDQIGCSVNQNVGHITDMQLQDTCNIGIFGSVDQFIEIDPTDIDIGGDAGKTITVSLPEGTILIRNTTLKVFFNTNDIINGSSQGCDATTLTVTNKSQVAPMLTTLAMVKAQPNMTDLVLAGITDDTLTTRIRAVSDLAEGYCRRSFYLSQWTDLVDGDNSEDLITRAFPVKEVTSVSVTKWDNSVDSFDITNDLLYRYDRGFITINQRSTTVPGRYFPYGKQNVTIVYAAGYKAIPSAVQQGVAEWVAEVCLRTTRDPSLAGETIKGYSWQAKTAEVFSMKESLSEPPASVRMLLAKFRDVRP